MTKLVWDAVGARKFETGVDHGVLFPTNPTTGAYETGVPWNGLASVNESPSGAEPSPVYADNIKYLNLMSAEEFNASIEAYTYPDAFAACDGSVEPTGATGLLVTQQERLPFGLCYRTKLGNDVAGDSLGYKLHIIYGAKAAPAEKAYNSINETPEPITFSWEITTTPVAVTGLSKPTACLIVDSTKVPEAKMTALEALLFGDADAGLSQLPTPDAIVTLLAAAG